MPDPSILIAFGPYGLRVLRNFLAGAATRGALLWDEEGSVGTLNERRLQTLALFWVPDRVEFRRPAGENLQAENSYELMDDLYRQIEMMEGSFDDIRQKLVAGVEGEKNRLLDPNRHREKATPSLDVYIIAQPHSQDMVGLVRNLMEPTMARLASDPAFETAQANRRLHFIQVFDFEDFWSPSMDPVRKSLRRMTEEGVEAVSAGGITAGRMYLFDGNTPAGKRPAASRQQEVVLFLEFLLLEGLRDVPDARAFFERQNLGVPPVCSVGIRVIERSSGLLRRLAAAAFARGWLEYIESSEGRDSLGSPFAELTAPFLRETLGLTVGEAELHKAASAEIAGIETAMLALPREDADWVESMRLVATQRTETAILRLSQQSGIQSGAVSRGVLKRFRTEIDETIRAAMQERNPRITLGTILEELRLQEKQFAEDAEAAKPSREAEAISDRAFDEAAQMQQEYVLYRSRQVQTAELKRRWWPRLAILFALAYFPVFVQGFSSGPLSGVAPSWVIAPMGALLLGLVFWKFGRHALHPLIGRIAERGRGFYTDDDRGRLTERVRRVARSAGVAGRIENYTEGLVYGLRQYVLGAVADEFRRARSLLQERHAEVGWLRGQVGDFLLSNHVDDRGTLPQFQEGRIHSDVRFSLERTDDLEAVAQTISKRPDRYREQIGVQKLFNSWSRPYGSRFLHPLKFLDDLSLYFTDKLEVDEHDSRRRAREIAAFLRRDARVSVCFQWFAADGLPSLAQGSLCPATWAGIPEVRSALMESGFASNTITTQNSQRLYLYQAVLGVPSELLEKPLAQRAREVP